VAAIRPWVRAALVAAGTLGFGFAVHGIVGAVAPSWTAGTIHDGGSTGRALADWVLIPRGHAAFHTWAYIALVAAIVALSQLRGWWRTAALIPTLYLTAFVWENVLVEQPAVTRLILFGALLIGLMTARPQGLLGTARVEIV
jgi:hypothetical protein